MLAWIDNRGAVARASAFAALAVAALTAAAPALAEPGRFMPVGDPAPAPLAFLNFCTRIPAECAPVGPQGGGAVSAADMAVEASAVAITSSGLTTAALTAEAVSSQPAEAAAASPSPAAGLAQEDPVEATGLDADASPAPLPYTAALARTLETVNRRVNRAIKPQPDWQTVGVAERWDLPLEEGLTGGDCEDYVLEKRRALVAAGVPWQNLSIAIAKTSWGEAHAVLLVLTDRGELVLDNLSSWVTPWQDENYHWLERQAPGKTFEWIQIGPKAS